MNDELPLGLLREALVPADAMVGDEEEDTQLRTTVLPDVDLR